MFLVNSLNFRTLKLIKKRKMNFPKGLKEFYLTWEYNSSVEKISLLLKALKPSFKGNKMSFHQSWSHHKFWNNSRSRNILETFTWGKKGVCYHIFKLIRTLFFLWGGHKNFILGYYVITIHFLIFFNYKCRVLLLLLLQEKGNMDYERV